MNCCSLPGVSKWTVTSSPSDVWVSVSLPACQSRRGRDPSTNSHNSVGSGGCLLMARRADRRCLPTLRSRADASIAVRTACRNRRRCREWVNGDHGATASRSRARSSVKVSAPASTGGCPGHSKTGSVAVATRSGRVEWAVSILPLASMARRRVGGVRQAMATLRGRQPSVASMK